uniref:Uncharacterized protein n=1 Tax=Meloidogyne enterolobii TaxID=390850 RepID=A0A6V7V8U0_MELEN|nr:unnamed protein product [Meloidogyne enterolobii]
MKINGIFFFLLSITLLFIFASTQYTDEDFSNNNRLDEIEDIFGKSRMKRVCTPYMRRRCCNVNCAGSYCFGFMCAVCC